MFKNHPYQYVYFNEAARGSFAEKNFCLDYWDVSVYDLIKYALKTDGAPSLGFGGTMIYFREFYFNDAEKARIKSACAEDAVYFISNSHVPYGERFIHPEFTQIKSVTVDGMRISSLAKRETPNAELDYAAAEKIANFNDSGDNADFTALFDGDFATFWQGEDGGEGVFLLFEFDEPVDYDFLGLRYDLKNMPFFPSNAEIFTSGDGINFTRAPLKTSADTYFYLDIGGEYRFLKINMGLAAADLPPRVCEMVFGHKQ